MVVRPTILDDFKTLVKQQGLSESTIIIKKNKGTAQRNQLEHQHAGHRASNLRGNYFCSVYKTYCAIANKNKNLYIFVHKLKFEQKLFFSVQVIVFLECRL